MEPNTYNIVPGSSVPFGRTWYMHIAVDMHTDIRKKQGRREKRTRFLVYVYQFYFDVEVLKFYIYAGVL